MPRFVVLTHDHPTLHWDFMLETDGVLRTWRLSHPPDSAESITATALSDHRRAYLDYEGPVSGGRGVVKQWDAGEYEMLEDSSIRLAVRLSGLKLIGIAIIDRSEHDSTVTFHLSVD